MWPTGWWCTRRTSTSRCWDNLNWIILTKDLKSHFDAQLQGVQFVDDPNDRLLPQLLWQRRNLSSTIKPPCGKFQFIGNHPCVGAAIWYIMMKCMYVTVLHILPSPFFDIFSSFFFFLVSFFKFSPEINFPELFFLKKKIIKKWIENRVEKIYSSATSSSLGTCQPSAGSA